MKGYIFDKIKITTLKIYSKELKHLIMPINQAMQDIYLRMQCKEK